jgi:hypothetical protein
MTSLRSLKLVVDANSMGVLSNYTCSPVSILTTVISKKVTFTGNVLHTSTEPESTTRHAYPIHLESLPHFPSSLTLFLVDS